MNLKGLSFCESVYASSMSRWHIRELTEVGLKLGGGIDTPSLCRRVLAPKGWDLQVPVTEERVTNLGTTCPECARAAMERP
jgi:hypothetical protein